MQYYIMEKTRLLSQENNGFGPLSKKRENRSQLAIRIFGFITAMGYFLYCICFGKKALLQHIFVDAGIVFDVLTALIFGEVIRRLFLYVEESYHVDARYLGSRVKALFSCVSFPGKNLVIFIIAVACLFIYNYRLSEKKTVLSLPEFTAVVFISSFGLELIGLRKLSDVEISDLSETQIKNVAVGLAWSYYFGYLKLILPGWDGMIESAVAPNYSVGNKKEDMKDKLSTKKLYIVMPKNCWCPDKFQKVDEKIVFAHTMPEQRRCRAGVQERAYKNSLYHISNPDGKVKDEYVMMEYATPLMALYDMQEVAAAPFTDGDLNEQVMLFYNTLKEILEKDPECRGKYELVLVGDNSEDLSKHICNTIRKKEVEIKKL